MTSEETPGETSGEPAGQTSGPETPFVRRATDGLAWRQQPAAESETPALPSASTTSPPSEPSVSAQGHPPRAVSVAGPTALSRRAFLFGLAAGLGGGLVGGAGMALLLRDDGSAQPAPATAGAAAANLSLVQTSAVIDVAARARQGIVRIDSTRRVATGTETDIGSGVILDTAGHILTNAHVVVDAETLKVTLPDGTQQPGILLGNDSPFTDIAVLQIGATKLSPIPMGDSAKLALGQTVIAIGNPLAEFDGSVSVGVVSGLNRRRVFDGVRQDDLIQTDAAVNSGNSGGALLNLEGQFVGMPTAILRQPPRGGQVVEGIAFALPVNRLLPIAQKIIADGSYPRPSFGFDHVDLPLDASARIRVPLDNGALVLQVVRGGPADAAGISVNDIITKVGDQDVNQTTPLLNTLLSYEPGQTVRVVLNRNGRIIETEVRLGKRS